MKNFSLHQLLQIVLIACLPFLTGYSYSQDVHRYELNTPCAYSNSPVQEGNDLVIRAQGGTRWSWTGPNNFSSTDQINIIYGVDPSYSGAYYLTMNDSIDDTTYYFVVHVQINVVNYIYVSSYEACASSDLRLTCNLNGLNYYWSSSIPGTFYPDENDQNPTLSDFQITGSCSIYLYATDGSNNYYDTVSVEVINCCTNEKTTFINNTTLSNFLANGGVFDQTTVIKGTLTVDITYDLSQTNLQELILISDDYSNIDILSGFSLTINKTYIHGCDVIWKRIQLEDKAILYLDGCLISDGEEAIFTFDCGNQTGFKFNGNSFINNYKSIVTYFSFPYFELNGNTFAGTQAGLALPPRQGEIPQAGIVAFYNKGLTLQGMAYKNNFEYMDFGIACLDTYLTIESGSSYFSDIHDFDNDGNTGAIVNLYNNNNFFAWRMLSKDGNSPNEYDFVNCDYGIYTTGCDLYITNNRMDNVLSGIYQKFGALRNIEIDNNTINCGRNGIFLWECGPAAEIQVTNNTIELESSGATQTYNSACIKFANTLVNNFLYADVSQNHLTVGNSSCYGFLGTSSYRTNFHHNDITLNDYDINLAGVKISDCEDDFISCNLINGPGYNMGNSTLNTPIAIQAVASMYSTISCNEMDETYSGIQIEGGCDGSDIKGNKFRDHTIGLHYNENAVTGAEDYKGNKFIRATYPTEGAWNENLFYTNSLYHYGANCSYCQPNPQYPTNFVTYQAGGRDYDCDGPVAVCGYADESSILSQNDSTANIVDYAISTDSLNFPLFNEELNWEQDRYLYTKLSQTPELISNNTDFEVFYDSTSVSSAGQFENTRSSLSSLLNVNLVTVQYIDSLKNIVNLSLDSIQSLNELLHQTTVNLDSIAQVNQISSLNSYVNGVQQLINSAMIGLAQIQNQGFSAVQSMNNEIAVTSVYEQNAKVINDIYLNTIAKGICDFSPIQLSQLKEIALQCPLSGGNAVYKARSMYSIVSDSVLNDKLICLEEGLLKHSLIKPNSESSSSGHLEFYPNPSVGRVTIFNDNILDGECWVNIYDAMGVVKYSISIVFKDSHTTIDVSQFKSGMYVVKILNVVSGKLSSGKLLIVK